MTPYFPFITLSAIMLAVPLAALPAYGHAVPIDYSLPPNTVIAERGQIPREIVLIFSERPDPRVSYIRVVDSENMRVDNNDFAVAGGNDREVSITLDTERMSHGLYSVSWFTMSLDDGHITQGAYVFGVGDVSVGEVEGSETTYVTSYADSLARWPLIVAQSAVVGMTISGLAIGRNTSANSSRFAKILLACSVTMGVSATVILFLQAGNLVEAAGSYAAAIDSLISASPAGMVWSLRIATAAVIGSLAVIFLFRPANALLYGVLATGALSLLSNSVLSHNSAAPFMPEFAIAADWIHFIAVSAWVGGLFYLSSIFMPAMKNLPEAARMLALSLPRFSVIATTSLGIIGVTGIYMAWIHLHSPDSLFETEYGAILTVKLAIALPMVILGAYHQIRLHKRMVAVATTRGSNQGPELTFGRTVRMEAFLGVAVLLAASLLTVTSPPAQELVSPERYTHQVTIDGTEITVAISPFRPGLNTFNVALEQNGSPTVNVHHVTMRFTNEDARIGPIVVTLDHNEDGTYSTTGGYLSQAGEWRIDLNAQRTGDYDLNHTFREMLGTEIESVQTTPELDSFAVLAIALAAAVGGGSAFYAVRSRCQQKRTSAAIGHA